MAGVPPRVESRRFSMSSLRGGSLAMQVANYPRNADREEQRARETLGRYRSREYVRRYKAEYTNGLGPKHLRSRVVAAGEKAVIAQLLREIDPAGSALLDVPCGTGKLGPLLQTFPVHVVAADASREMLALAGDEYDPAQLLRVLQCDASALPFKDGSVDVVICLRLFHLLPPATRRMILAPSHQRPAAHRQYAPAVRAPP